MGLIALTFYLLIPVETWFYWWIWQVFEPCREKLVFDTKILLSPILLVSTTTPPPPTPHKWGRVGTLRPFPDPLVVCGKTWKMKTRGISKSIPFGLRGSAWALCQTSWEVWWALWCKCPAGSSSFCIYPTGLSTGYLFSIPLKHMETIIISQYTLSTDNTPAAGTRMAVYNPGKNQRLVIRALLNPGSKTHCCGELL